MRIKSSLIPLALTFFPFVSPLPIGTDVQPTFFLLALICILFQAQLYKVDIVDIAFISLIALSLVHQENFDSPNLQGFIRFTFAYFAYIFFKLYIGHISARFIFILTCLHTFTLFLHFALGPTFTAIAENFVRSVKVSSFGIRGVSGFAPEPGFAGAIAVSLIGAAFFVRDFKGASKFFLPSLLLGVVSVAITRSGTGSVLLGLFLPIYYFKPSVKNVAIFCTAILIGIYIIFNVDLGRGTSALKFLLTNPMLAIQQDLSIGARVLSIIVSTVAVYEFPFGAGIGSFEQEGAFLAAKYGLFHIATGPNGGGVGGLSMLSIYTVELGMLWIIFLTILFGTALHRFGGKAAAYLFLSFYFILTSFSISFPPTWFFLAACCMSLSTSSERHRIHHEINS